MAKKTKKKIIIGITGCILCLAAGGIWTVNSLVDRDTIRNQLYRTIEKQTGRKIQFDHLVIKILPWPEIMASNIVMENMPDGKAKFFIKAGTLTARMNLWALWHKQVDLDFLRLSDVSIHLEKNQNQQKNWEFTPVQKTESTDSGSVNPHKKWSVNLKSVHLDTIQGWYDDAYQNRHVQFFLKTADIRQLEGNKIHFDLQGSSHKADYIISGKINHVDDLLSHKKTQDSFPVKFQLALSEYLHNQNVGNIHVNGVVNDFLKQRGYSIILRGTILNLRNFNFLFPHANLPSVENMTLNSVIEDGALSSEAKAKPQVKLLQLHTGKIRFRTFHHDVDIKGVQLTANQLNENINVQASGTISGVEFRWIGDFGTLSNFQQILFSDLKNSIPIKGNFASAPYTAQVYGTIGGQNPSLRLKFNLLNLDGMPTVLGQVKAQDVFYDGTLHLPFSFRQKSLKTLQKDIKSHFSTEGNVTSKILKINSWQFRDFSTHVNWKDHVLNLNSLKLKEGPYFLLSDLTYDLTQPEPQFLLFLHPSHIPMEWIEKQYKLMEFYSGPVTIMGHLGTKGLVHQQWIQNLTGQVDMAGTNGFLKTKGLKFYTGQLAKTLPLKENVSVQCLATHMNISHEQLLFDNFILQTKRFILNGNGVYSISDNSIDFHLIPDVTLGILDASIPVKIRGDLTKPIVNFDTNKNKVFVLNINKPKKMTEPLDSCKNVLIKAAGQ